MAAGKRCRNRCGEPTQDQLSSCLRWLIGLPQAMFTERDLHGNSDWKLQPLALMAVLWAWMPAATLGQRYKMARNLVAEWSQRWIVETFFLGKTYQGFIGALTRHTGELILAITQELRREIENTRHWKVAGMPVFAIDGTKVGVPWTRDTDQKLGKHARKKTSRKKRRAKKPVAAKVPSANSRAHQEIRPQIMLTLMWNVGTGLPWSWKMGPVSASEREHARELIPTLPANSLAVEDAGFTGYDFWQSMIREGHHFVARIGSNVKLLKKLGWKVKVKNRGELAHLWPDAQRANNEEPITIRLVRFQTARSTVVVATTILSRSKLSDEQIAEIYRLRWGIEGWFRCLKQTFGRRVLLSKTAAHAEVELQWSIVGLALIQLHGIKALIDRGLDPHKLSEAEAIRVIQSTILQIDFTPRTRKVLSHRLKAAVLDDYVRTRPKQGCHVHRKKTTKPTGQPQIVTATEEQRRDARRLQTNAA
jgi:hypothetical protein